MRALVVIGPSDSDPSMALIVGVTGRPNTDDSVDGNYFNNSFKEAARRMNARFEYDSFEASVLEIAQSDLGQFMEALSDVDAERVARARMAMEDD